MNLLLTLLSALMAAAWPEIATGLTFMELKLVDGHTSLEGTLLVRVRHNDSTDWRQWGLLCDDGWSEVSADVACRQLGFGPALEYTVANKFQTDLTGKRVLLDDVRCSGSEPGLHLCRSRPPGEHNCETREAAGVRCSAAGQVVELSAWKRRVQAGSRAASRLTKPSYRLKLVPIEAAANSSSGSDKAVSGLVVAILSSSEKSPSMTGGLCADRFVTLREASVVCRELGLGSAAAIWKHPVDLFATGADNATSPPVLLSVAGCRGSEAKLLDCGQVSIGQVSIGLQSDRIPIEQQLSCMELNASLGVSCTAELPDLVLDYRMLQLSAYVARVPMYYLNCALEESCAASTAFEVRNNNQHWPYAIRTLLRFSTIVSNVGSSDFHPYNSSESWTWHTCHMHYHSMPYFAAYEIYQQKNGTHLSLASGHKASFCLEDSACQPGVSPKYQCSRDPWDTGNQGISMGCSDNYLHDLDCQWIDITDLPFGFYMFRVVLNPEFKSAELNYENNAVVCRLVFSPYQAQLHSCRTKHAFDV